MTEFDQTPTAELHENLVEHNWVAILDGGAQYGGLIDRNVRELGIRTKLLPFGAQASELSQAAAIIMSGGPRSVNEPEAPHCDPGIFDLRIPVLGICYGMQELVGQ